MGSVDFQLKRRFVSQKMPLARFKQLAELVVTADDADAHTGQRSGGAMRSSAKANRSNRRKSPYAARTCTSNPLRRPRRTELGASACHRLSGSPNGGTGSSPHKACMQTLRQVLCAVNQATHSVVCKLLVIIHGLGDQGREAYFCPERVLVTFPIVPAQLLELERIP